jgi:DNA-binding NarL/FixJ family response regulator
MSGQLRTAGDCESRSLLIVDDDDGFRSFVVTTLAWVDLGVTLREAASGEDALLLARIDPPSLVMLDVCLPGISGFEICRELREQCGAELPIILVSGTRVDALDRSAGLLIGCDDFLVKPVDPNELLARVRRLLGRSAPQRTRAASREYGLTRRELTVLQQLASGLRQAEIAAELLISPKTVASHVQHILTKLGVHSGAQAVAFAHDNDLLALATPPARRSV